LNPQIMGPRLRGDDDLMYGDDVFMNE
jgi:hypothetical protein